MSRDVRVSYSRSLRDADMSRVTGRRRSLPTQAARWAAGSGPSDKAYKRAVARIAGARQETSR